MTEQEAVMGTLEDYARAYCAKDLSALMSVFDDGDEISLIGTGADELCRGREAIERVFLRNFEEATAHKFEWHWTDIIVIGTQALVAISLTIHLEFHGKNLKLPLRWTVSLLKKNHRWYWLHRHASSAASGQQDGGAYPVKGE